MQSTPLNNSQQKAEIEAIKRSYDMRDVVEAELGRPRRRGTHPQWCCPFHAEQGPSFTAYSNHAYCFGCRWSGDIFKWTMQIKNVSFAEAIRLLGGQTHRTSQPSLQSNVRQANASPVNFTAASSTNLEAQEQVDLPEAPPEQWQEAALGIVAERESRLWDKHNELSAKVRAYLAGRGLTEDTLQTHYIGYNMFERKLDKVGLWLPPGITIPLWNERLNTLYGVNVRLTRDAMTSYGQKYMKARGSKCAPLGLESIAGKSQVFVLEGEFDTILTLQTLRALGEKARYAGAFTMGSASSHELESWLLHYPQLLHPRRYLIATDGDQAGQDAARCWLEKTKRARLWRPPSPCKDVTELWQKHGYDGVRWWLMAGLQKYTA
ncbi:MAG: CHC2 zinc finger domain-containing protein [Chloroflexia bacterium]